MPRALMWFQEYDGWDCSVMEADCRTSITWDVCVRPAKGANPLSNRMREIGSGITSREY
jgi:hypothetical protein